jgi:hypothetical protein
MRCERSVDGCGCRGRASSRMEEDVEACVEVALKERLLTDWGRMAVGLLCAEDSCEEVVWCDERARVNPPRPSCVGNRIMDVGRPCN